MRRYRVIGNDGCEYGPVSAGLVREWMAEGRLHGGSLICAEGETEWCSLRSLADFGSGGGGAPPQAIGSARPWVRQRQTNGWAVAGFISGLLSVILGCCCCCCLPLAPLGVVFSLIGLIQIQNNSDTQSGTGFAVAGLILSLLGLLCGSLSSLFSMSSATVDQVVTEMERDFSFMGPFLNLL